MAPSKRTTSAPITRELSSRAKSRATLLSPGFQGRVTQFEGSASSSLPTFRMPAEWEPHEATWLGWPHELTDWPGKFAPIPWAFAEIVRHLTRGERVNLLVEKHAARSRVKEMLRKSGADLDAITYFDLSVSRGRSAHSGPIAVLTKDNTA